MEKVNLGFINSNIRSIQLVKDEAMKSYKAQVVEAKSTLEKGKEEFGRRATKLDKRAANADKKAIEVDKKAAESNQKAAWAMRELNVNAPTYSNEAEVAPNQQVEGDIDQQVEEALVKLEKEVVAEKTVEEVIGDKAAITEELAKHPNDFMDTEEVGSSFQSKEHQAEG
ncbi:hypothetical protein NE237_004321 [Protea cynaroides]|uniref:Uncharacterized protein n=1 Tax=Protea cynaroides TaxID=273540 RepID=A0A9Q0KIM7_9MAGN|nr:hypothetical protein NE237_004321 [Protea cynaroides]